jgi:hypothetical protein
MICIMHESENYGFLEINSRKISEKALAGMCGITPSKCRKYLLELEETGVLSIDERGVVFSRRMVKDNELCEKRREAGKMGGNPALVKQKDNQTPSDLLNQTANQNPTPSSSSSSSTSVKRERESAGAAEPDDWGDDDPTPDPKPKPNHAEQAQTIVASYPRREKVADALKIVERHLRDGEDFQAMLYGTQACAKVIESMPSRANGKYVPSALAFFLAKRWKDDPETIWRRPEAKPDHRAQKASREYAEDEPHTIPIIR